MSQLISFFPRLAKGQVFLNEHNCTRGHVGVRHPFLQIKASHSSRKELRGDWHFGPPFFSCSAISVAPTASGVILGITLYQPTTQTVFFFPLPSPGRTNSPLSPSIFPSFVHQCNCTLSRNRKELPQSVRKPVVKASFRSPLKMLGKFAELFTPQWYHPGYLF